MERLTVVDNNGDEHDYVQDDETDYWYRYGVDDEDQSTNEHELRIYRNAGCGKGGPVLVATYFHPRYAKVFFEA